MPLLMGTDPVDLAALTIHALIGRPAGPAFWRRRQFHLPGWRQHNVEEAGNLPHFLPEVYAGDAGS